MSDLGLVNSFATLSNQQLHAMRTAIDTVIHRREGGLPPRPGNRRYFSLSGEKACLIDGFNCYAVTESGKVYSYKSSRYILAAASVELGAMVHLKYPGR
jgi:hypothetical protein